MAKEETGCLGMNKCSGLRLGSSPGCPAKQCTEPSPGAALLSARVGFLHSFFHSGMDCEQLQMRLCCGPPLIFWWAMLGLRHEQL